MTREKNELTVYPMLVHRDVSTVVAWACKRLQELRGGGDVIHQGAAFGDLKDDTEIRADRELGELFRKRFSSPNFMAHRITVEGFEEDLLPGHEAFYDKGLWYCVDPLDGSLNYKLGQSLFGLPHALPFAACVTVLKKSEGAVFDDVITAAIADLRTGDLWSASSGMVSGGYRGAPPPHFSADAELNGRQLYRGDTYHQGQDRRKLRLDLGSQVVIGEMYYPENRERLARAFAGKKGYLRSFGSAAFEMALVASGTAVAFVCDRQKQHELGAGYALVKGSGGVAVDWDGQDLGPRAYDFKTQTPCVLAANQAIAEQVLGLLHEA